MRHRVSMGTKREVVTTKTVDTITTIKTTSQEVVQAEVGVVSAVVERVVDVVAVVVVDEAVVADVAAQVTIVMVAAEVVVGVLAMNEIRTSSRVSVGQCKLQTTTSSRDPTS